MFTNFSRYVEIFFVNPFIKFFSQLRFVSTKWGTMCTTMSTFTLFVRATVSDNCFYFDQGWTSQITLTFLNCCFNSSQIIAILNKQRLPAICLETLSHILREAKVQLTVERNIVGVVQEDQFTKLKMACKGSSFTSYTFHQVTVTANSIGEMINNFEIVTVVSSSKLSFSKSHTNSHCNTLSKRTSCSINTCSMSELWMPWCFAAPLTELFQIFQRKIITAQVKQAVQKHRTMSC
ncbi:hypothetical protein D3C81_1061540 [compost metagenome]